MWQVRQRQSSPAGPDGDAVFMSDFGANVEPPAKPFTWTTFFTKTRGLEARRPVQTAACARIFFARDAWVRDDWKLFSERRVRDHRSTPRSCSVRAGHPIAQSHPPAALSHPGRLIYSAGLRLSEGVSLTVNDIFGGIEADKIRVGGTRNRH